MRPCSITAVAALIALAVVFAPRCAGALPVTVFNAEQFAAMAAGQPIPGLTPAESQGLQPFTMWVVRVAFAWESVAANATESAAAFQTAADRVPTTIARFAELVVRTPDEMAIADVFGVTETPFIRAFHSKVARPEVVRGNSVSGRVIATGGPVAPADVGSANALIRYAYESVSPNFNDPVTDSMYPSAEVVKDEKALAAIAPKLAHSIANIAAPSAAVALKAADVVHALVLVSNLRATDVFTLDTVATALATGAALRGRGGVRVFLGDQRNFPEWAPENDGTAVIVPVKALGTSGFDKTKANQRVAVKSVAEVASSIVAFADAIEPVAEFLADKEHQVAAARAGAPRLTAPPNDAPMTPFPVRRIDTGAQFQKHVTELKMGAAVVFFVRETDRFFGKVAKVARKVAESAASDNSATIAGRKTAFNFEVFIIDGEVHKDAARELQVPQVPSVGFFLELKDKAGVKGLRFFKSKDIDNAAAIIKFMRNDLFDGREMLGIDPLTVKFNPAAKGTILSDVALMTDYIDVDPRRFDSAATADTPIPDYARLLGSTLRRVTGESTTDTDRKRPVPKNETPAQKKKREAKEAKQTAREEEKKAKLKAELEARAEAKRRKAAEKQQQEAELAQKRKEDAERKVAEIREKRQREESDGTAAKRRAAKKAKAARLERLNKLKKAKLAAKVPKDRATMVKLWADDSKQAAAAYTVVDKETGAVSVLDRIL